MFGFGDVWVFLGYALTIGAVVLCAVYGILNWNKPKENVANEAKEEAAWESRDPDLNEGDVK